MNKSVRFYFEMNKLARRILLKPFRLFSDDSNYQRLDPIQHILLRPEMYIGQIQPTISSIWIVEGKSMTKKDILYSPALLKIFDEILVNATDNARRDSNTSNIDISTEILDGSDDIRITIKNNGKGIPIKIHDTEKIYIPELIFGNLLTGSNFEVKDNSYTGGRHGYGAKLTNIFSKKFEIETYDSQNRLLYKQSWENNMLEKTPPIIKERKNMKDKDFTKISFIPDLKRFGTSCLHSQDNSNLASIVDIMQLFERRAHDVAGCLPTVKVSFNSNKISYKSFLEYASLYCPANESIDDRDKSNFIEYIDINQKWQIAVLRSRFNDNEDHVSFVNTVWTSKGGSHVNAIQNQIYKFVNGQLLSKKIVSSTTSIKSKFMLVVNSMVNNPCFDSQTKDTLTTRPTDFATYCALPDTFLSKVVKNSGILDDLVNESLNRDKNRFIKKTKETSKLNIPKLDDAIHAGTSRSLECSLILTEGDSAKALAVAGLEVVGREFFGVMPLKGKIMNVRDSSPSTLVSNQELLNLCKILGLRLEKNYSSDLEGLRYGHVVLMCDQDIDGSHIKGLILNFFHHYWPNLLVNHQGFFQQLITPLVKARPKSGSSDSRAKNMLSFYSLQEFNNWVSMQFQNPKNNSLSIQTENTFKNKVQEVSKNYNIKYYKGLGTSTASEGRDYFKGLDRNCKIFVNSGNIKSKFDLAFDKSNVSARKSWLEEKYDPSSFVDPANKNISFSEFIDNELIHFAHADNLRSLPSAIDGLKPSQRKVLFSCFKRNLVSEIKVVQLSGYISEQTAYHHGEQSLHNTIIKMAQDFVGSNNIPYLVASGQFGTRAQGGKDFASPRYIYTYLSKITRYLFPEIDDEVLEYLDEDGIEVEPKYYLPIIPTLLLNGCIGIGMGWSTSIPSYNIKDLIQSVENLLSNSKLEEITPFVEGFKGTICNSKTDSEYIVQGLVEKLSSKQIKISELPVGKWTDDYKEFLIKLCDDKLIKSFTENHTSTSVSFTLTVNSEMMDYFEKKNFVKPLKLESKISLSNMHAFNKEGKIIRFSSPQDIISYHFNERLKAYRLRKDLIIKKASEIEIVNRNKSRFIKDIIAGNIKLFSPENNQSIPRKDIMQKLVEFGYTSLSTVKIENQPQKDASNADNYSYLLDMPLSSLTLERANTMHELALASSKQLEIAQNVSEIEMWKNDLGKLKKLIK